MEKNNNNNVYKCIQKIIKLVRTTSRESSRPGILRNNNKSIYEKRIDDGIEFSHRE